MIHWDLLYLSKSYSTVTDDTDGLSSFKSVVDLMDKKNRTVLLGETWS